MLSEGSLVVFEDFLQLVGAFIGFSVAYVSYRGYKDTSSPTMLRLTLSFILLGGGFALSGIIGLANIGVLPYVTLAISVLVVAASFLETAGYFFLAFSHMMNARRMVGIGLPALALPDITPVDALKSISLYFLLYGLIETVLAYMRDRRFETLGIAVGLGMIASAEFVRWASFLYPTATIILLTSLVIKVIGFSTLYIPVVKYVTLGGGR
ncbi:MAG: hypothetical protein M1503_10750 [Thaumarchaeota archaeon]|nr:hypothetical protein [Nitrososphaerota archaeon]MCL5318720.1 hypothetical protein [Nitrososphaerota archaeon]